MPESNHLQPGLQAGASVPAGLHLRRDTASWATGSPANHELGLVKELEDRLKIFAEKSWKEDLNPLSQPKSKLGVGFCSQARDIVEQHGLILRGY